MYNIIITGSLGTGKSSVADILKKKHFPVLSADALINNIYKEGIFTKEMADIFSITPDKVNKVAIAAIAFQNKKKLLALEKLLYPELKKRVQSLKDFYQKKSLYLFYEAPVFFEKNKTIDHDCILVVSASKETCYFRLSKNKMSKKQFDEIFHLQIPIKEKEAFADYVIFNNLDLNHLELETELFLKYLKKKYE